MHGVMHGSICSCHALSPAPSSHAPRLCDTQQHSHHCGCCCAARQAALTAWCRCASGSSACMPPCTSHRPQSAPAGQQRPPGAERTAHCSRQAAQQTGGSSNRQAGAKSCRPVLVLAVQRLLHLHLLLLQQHPANPARHAHQHRRCPTCSDTHQPAPALSGNSLQAAQLSLPPAPRRPSPPLTLRCRRRTCW